MKAKLQTTCWNIQTVTRELNPRFPAPKAGTLNA